MLKERWKHGASMVFKSKIQELNAWKSEKVSYGKNNTNTFVIGGCQQLLTMKRILSTK